MGRIFRQVVYLVVNSVYRGSGLCVAGHVDLLGYSDYLSQDTTVVMLWT